MRHRAALAAALATLLALAPALVLPALAASSQPGAVPAVQATAASGPKVVIVVGATHGDTERYRDYADDMYDVARQYTSNVVKVYSPNATWKNVKAAAKGASILIYLGHGSGYPRDDNAVFNPNGHDGMGLNSKKNPSDNVAKYYGESYMANDIRLARNAVVILSHLCFASGNSMSGDPEPTFPVAEQRIDNFASGFLRAGARAVIADVWNAGVHHYIRSILSTDQTIWNMWATSPSNHGHVREFVPLRNPAYQAFMDPTQPAAQFHRSIVGAMGMRTTDVVAGAGDAFTGKATVQDSTGPELWSMDGPTTISPNFDGYRDRLNLWARFSETVSWSVKLKDANGDVVRSQDGTGHQAAISWDALDGDDPAPDGEYTWHLQATDPWGNPASEESGSFTVAHEAIPATAVLELAPGATTTSASSVTFTLAFAGPVSGLAKGDFTRTGTATCKLGKPAGGPTVYTIQLTECTTGTATLTLASGSVTDASAQVGPVGAISAKVTIDRSKPTAAQPRGTLRKGLVLGGGTGAALPLTLSWSGSDSGSGVASYDVRVSRDGGKYQKLATKTTATSLETTVTPGDTYRFKVRARDKAGNVGSWAGGWTWYPELLQQTSGSLKYSGTWSNASDDDFSGGSARVSTEAGASVTYKFTGRSVAWVTRLAPDAGQVKVYVDGDLVATVDTYADSVTERHVAFSKSWSSYAKHKIKLVVVGTDGRPRVDVDAFEVVR